MWAQRLYSEEPLVVEALKVTATLSHRALSDSLATIANNKSANLGSTACGATTCPSLQEPPQQSVAHRQKPPAASFNSGYGRAS